MKHTCILDACTIINLLHIDEKDFLLQQIENLNIKISEEVINEVKKNFTKKYNGILLNEEINENLKNIETNINTFYIGKTVYNNEIDTTIEIEKIKDFLNYNKTNGELSSSYLAFYLSRKEKARLYFYTDDFVAKEEFQAFFDFQQIGQINDSVDFLCFLFWINENKNIFSQL